MFFFFFYMHKVEDEWALQKFLAYGFMEIDSRTELPSPSLQNAISFGWMDGL